jgi:hypothetical protein
MRICFSMRMTDKTRCAQSRQVGLNKTLDDIHKIVGFKKLTEGIISNIMYCTYYSNSASLETTF